MSLRYFLGVQMTKKILYGRTLRAFQEFFNKSPDVACRNGLLLKGVEAIDVVTPEEFQNKLQAREEGKSNFPIICWSISR